MPNILADRVLESSVSAGTGVFTLAGAVLGFRAFSAVCAVTDTMPYYIEGVDAQGRPTGEWEYGLGTYSAANQLTRTTVRGSSNAGLAVAFAAGTKLVGLGVAAPNSTATRQEWRAALGLTAVGDAVATAVSTLAARAALGLVVGTDVLAPNGSGVSLTGIFGIGQTWQTVTGSRALGVTYTNTTGRPIMVNVRATMTDASNTVAITVGGVLTGGGSASNTNLSAHTVVIPNGATYVASAVGGALSLWAELR